MAILTVTIPVTSVSSWEVIASPCNQATLKRVVNLNGSLDNQSEKYVLILDMLFSFHTQIWLTSFSPFCVRSSSIIKKGYNGNAMKSMKSTQCKTRGCADFSSDSLKWITNNFFIFLLPFSYICPHPPHYSPMRYLPPTSHMQSSPHVVFTIFIE